MQTEDAESNELNISHSRSCRRYGLLTNNMRMFSERSPADYGKILNFSVSPNGGAKKFDCRKM